MDRLREQRPSAHSWFLVHPQGIVVRRTGDGVALPTSEDVRALGLAHGDHHEIGSLQAGTAWAASVEETSPLPEPFALVSLRSLHALVDATTFRMAGRAAQIIEWASTHRFCGRCGAKTERSAHERSMRCPACSLHAYPRIAPAIIVLVRRGEEALLARHARSTTPMYSTLAGFAEPGESLEETLAREVHEEVGIEVRNARYFGSQPWPFPHSLMIGFFAEWAGGEIRADGTEILDARWFRADALPLVPPAISIARQLIDTWQSEVMGTVRSPSSPEGRS